MESERVQAIRAELAESSPQDFLPAGVLASRPATESEQSGRRYLTRASATAALGGIIIAGLASGAFASLAKSEVATLGMVVGLVIAALGVVSFVEPSKSKLMTGAIIIVLSLLSLPTVFGGLVVGAIASIIGGAMLISYEPPTGEIAIETVKGHIVRRAIALVIDFMAVLMLHVVLGRFLPGVANENAPSNTISVFISWMLWWGLAVVVPSVMLRQTAGRALMALRICDPFTGARPATVSVIMRECGRFVVSVGFFIMVVRTFSNNHGRLWVGVLVAVLLMGVIAVAEYLDVLGRITGSVSGQDVPVYTGNPMPDKNAVVEVEEEPEPVLDLTDAVETLSPHRSMTEG